MLLLQPALGVVARSKDLLSQLSKNCNVYFFRFLLRHMDRSLNGQVGWRTIFLLMIVRLPFSLVQVQTRTRVVPKQDNPVWFRHKVKKVRVDCIVRKSFGCQEKESESDFSRNCSALKKTVIEGDNALQENVLFVRLSSTQLSFRETSRSLARW